MFHHMQISLTKGILSILMIASLSFPLSVCAVSPSRDKNSRPDFESTAKSALLMEASTGKVLYEKDADTRRPPASITKIMTLILIFDSLKSGVVSLDDTVTVSSHAASMGGSQVFLEMGETQTADTMIKCIAVASGNDACVAMAEHIAGSEESFVNQMNERARQLGMKNTHFVNCCGLDAEDHYTTARDIAIMSRELITKYPDIFRYTTIWTDTITHVTRRGSSSFGLTNTNKLIRQYEGACGLKTGSTAKAGFCLSGTAVRDGITLISVVMACDSSKERVQACSRLLDYGFSSIHLYSEKSMPLLPKITVKNGRFDQMTCRYENNFTCITTGQIDPSGIKRRIDLPDSVTAPVKEGQLLGKITYSYDNETLGAVNILAADSIEKANYLDNIKKLFQIIIFSQDGE